MKRNSLIIRYLLIVLAAFLMWPFVLPASMILYQLPPVLERRLSGEPKPANPYASRQELISRWHGEALRLDGAGPEQVDKVLAAMKKELPEADMFWVDGGGRTRLALTREELPAQWSAGDGIAFLKRSYDADPFTVVAFIGQKPEQGFMALQVNQALMRDNPAYKNIRGYHVCGVPGFSGIVMAFFLPYPQASGGPRECHDGGGCQRYPLSGAGKPRG